MATAKPKTIRATDETMDKLKKISEEMQATNQGAALDALIDLYERDKARAVLPERQTEIDDFNLLLHKLGVAYTASLQLNADAEERVRAAYANETEATHTLVRDQQNKIDDLNDQLKRAFESFDIQRKENDKLRTELEGKDKLMDALQRGADADKDKIKNLEHQISETNELHEKIAALNTEVEDLKKQLEAEKKAHVETQAKANAQVASTIERFNAMIDKFTKG